MNLLQLIQEFTGRTNIPVPTYVIGNPDPQILQAKGLLNEFCDDMTLRNVWEFNTQETLHVSLATEDQGAINTICPLGYQGMLLETVFDRTQRLWLFGGLSASEWQARKAFNFTGPYYQFRLRGGRLLFNPAPVAGHTIAWEYNSSFYVKNNAVTVPDPATARQYWEKDTDSCLLGDALPIAYLRWAWKKEKGLEYAEDFNKYERMVATYSARDKAAPILDMGDCQKPIVPGIFVPAGSWPL